MNKDLNQSNKRLVRGFWQSLEAAAPGEQQAVVDSVMASDLTWHGHDPVGDLHGANSFVNDFWQPLLHSFPDIRRQTWLFFGGESNGRVDGDITRDGRTWVTGTGCFTGVFAEDYLGIPATGSQVNIRWGDCSRVVDGRIVEVFFLLDLIDLMQQAGCHVLPPSLGADHVYPPPKAGDGILLDAQEQKESAYSLDHIRRFNFESLNGYDETNLESMDVPGFFHPEVHWYGPGGIGACYSLKEFQDYHQLPWLHAYPDRKIQDLDGLFAEGNYSGGTGWTGVIATHKGEYKGVRATGRTIKFNGLDWWKREGDLIVENWVFVDMIHLFRQFGIDLFDRLHP